MLLPPVGYSGGTADLKENIPDMLLPPVG